MSQSDEVVYLPFHAINEFMTGTYRLQVIRQVLSALQELPGDLQARLNRYTRQWVQIPGFRNSAKAPAALKAQAMVSAFEKQPDLVATILQSWSGLHTVLREEVIETLSQRQWELLPGDADRTRLPGFLAEWPEGENFETLVAAYRAYAPSSTARDDDISLMAVWLSGRLPYLQHNHDADPDGTSTPG